MLKISQVLQGSKILQQQGVVMQVNNKVGLDNEGFKSIREAKEQQKEALENLSSPRPIDATDGSSLAIADQLLAQANSLAQGIRNANDAIGILQIADSTLSNITSSAIRMNELSVALGNPALNSEQRSMITSEANALTQSMLDSTQQAVYNGKNLFTGSMTFVTGTGSTSVNLQSPSTNNLSVENQQSIQDFIYQVSKSRADIGAAMNGIQSGINSNLSTVVNVRSAESNLQDNNTAENYNELNTAKLLENAALYANSFNVRQLQARIDSLLA